MAVYEHIELVGTRLYSWSAPCTGNYAHATRRQARANKCSRCRGRMWCVGHATAAHATRDEATEAAGAAMEAK